MEDSLFKRAEDLARRCERNSCITNTCFLTPEEAYRLKHWNLCDVDYTMVLNGGVVDAERQVAFFLPEWMEEDAFEPSEYICAIEMVSHFGLPGHRDYLGAVMGLGIDRAWVGDIIVDEYRGWLMCLPSVKQHILLNLDKVGHFGIKVREVHLSEVPCLKRTYKEKIFSVNSPRLDTICAGMFGLSRSSAVERIVQGFVSLNYTVCLKADAQIHAGDVLSLRGKGKGIVMDTGSRSSKKGRLFIKIGLFQ